MSPSVYGDRIVWADCEDPSLIPSLWKKLYMYEISTEKITEISKVRGIIEEIQPRIYGNFIVWDDAFLYIYLYDIPADKENILPVKGRNPTIFKNMIAYEVDSNKVAIYDLSTGSSERIEDSFLDHSVLRKTTLDDVAIYWLDSRESHVSEDYYLYAYDTAKKSVTRLTPSSAWRRHLNTDSKRIVWSKPSFPSTSCISLYDLPSKTCTILSYSPPQQYVYASWPTIYKDTVVWADLHGGLIHVNKIFFAPQILSVANPQPLVPGSSITITGNNFGFIQDSDSKVVFANGSVGLVQSWSNDRIACAVTNGAQSGTLKVITPGGESTAFLSDNRDLTYNDTSGDGTITTYDAALALAQGKTALEAAQIAERVVGLL